MSDLFTATTAAQVEESLARGDDIEKEVSSHEDFSTFTITPLISACKRGALEVVDSLLNHGADPHHCPKKMQMGPIQMAAFKGHVDIIQRLIKAGADINDNHDGGWRNFPPLS